MGVEVKIKFPLRAVGILVLLLILGSAIAPILVSLTPARAEIGINLWVNSFTGDFVAWDEQGASPYLNDDGTNWIHEAKRGAEGYFGFQDTQLDGTINSVTLYIECYGEDTNDKIEVYIDSKDGSGYDLEGTVTVDQLTYAYETLVCTSLDTWAEIDFASIYLEHIAVAGGDDIYVRRAYLSVDYTDTGGRGGGNPGSMEQVIFGGYYNLLSTSATEYNSLVGGDTWGDTESEFYKLVSTDGVIKNLRVKLNAAPGVGTKYTFTLMVNGNPSALTFDIADAATSGSNMVNKIDVTGGDYVSLRCIPDGTPTARYATWTSVFEGDTSGESLILGGTSSWLDTTDIEYSQVMCAYTTWGTTESEHSQVVPTSGTIKNFYVKLSEDPGTAPDAYRFTLRKGGVSQTLTVTITADDTTGSDLVNSFTVAAGDALTLMVEPLNTPSAAPHEIAWGMTFVADIDGESIVLGGSTDPLHSTNTEYNYLTGYEGNTWNVDETLRYQLGQVCTLKKLYILLSAAPGAGNNYAFTIRIAGADSNVVVTVADAATTGNSAALEDTVALDEYVDLKVIPTDIPDLADAYWGFVCYIEPYVPIDTYTWTFQSTTTTTSATTTSSVTDTDTTTVTTATTTISTDRTTSTGVGSEDLWVYYFGAEYVEWDTEQGDPPYLDDSSDNWIHEAATGLALEGDFYFEDLSGSGTITDVDIFFECSADDGPGDDGFNAFIWDGTDWVFAGLVQPASATYAYASVDISTILDTVTKVNVAQLYVVYIKSGGGDDVYIRRCYINVDYEPVTTITSCTTSTSTSCETTTLTQYTSSCDTTEVVYIWTVVQIVVDPITTVTVTSQCVTTTTVVTSCTTEGAISTVTVEDGTTCTTELTCTTTCDTSVSTDITCETSCLTSEITETSCQTVTVTHTTECETVCETSTVTEDTTITTYITSVSTDETCTTICETSISTSETCTTTCDTSVYSSTSSTTTCATDTDSSTYSSTSSTTICDTSVYSSTSSTTTCDTSVSTSETCTTTCETATETETETSCETTTLTHVTSTETTCETLTETECETTCETSTVTHTTDCETICETETETETETECETTTVTHVTSTETTCETSTETECETTCETTTKTSVSSTTTCTSSTDTSVSSTTTCSSSTDTSVSSTTTCTTSVATSETCTTTCQTSTETSESTTCTTTTITHVTECSTTCETSTITSVTSTSMTSCTTSVSTSETCETICETSVKTSVSSTTTCTSFTETSVSSTTTCTTSVSTSETCTTVCDTSVESSTSTSCITTTITHTTECITTCETSTETSKTTTCISTCTTSISTSETCTTTCDTSVISSTSSTTTCDTSVYSSTSSTTICDTSIISSTSTSCITTTITHTTECSTTCETLTETECETTCETSTITSESCTTTCETSVETSVSSTTTCTSSTKTSVSSTTTTTCDTITSVDTTCTTSCETLTSVTTTCTTSCETDEIVETVCETEEETETITETSCVTTTTTTTGCETTCLTCTSVTTSVTTSCMTTCLTTSDTTSITTMLTTTLTTMITTGVGIWGRGGNIMIIVSILLAAVVMGVKKIW